MQFVTEATVYLFFSVSSRNELIVERTSLHIDSSKVFNFTAFFIVFGRKGVKTFFFLSLQMNSRAKITLCGWQYFARELQIETGGSMLF